jgi:hypothetical protein
LRLAEQPLDRARAHQTLAETYSVAVRSDETWTHLHEALGAYREAGVAPPASLYAELANISWRPSRGVRLPEEELEDLLRTGLALAREQGDGLSEARIFSGIALGMSDPAQWPAAFAELRQAIDRLQGADRRSYTELLGQLSFGELEHGTPQAAKEILERAAAAGADGDLYHFQCASLALQLGDLRGLEAVTERHAMVVASAGPHLRQHARRGRGALALVRGDFSAALDNAREAAKVIDAHPETVFCNAAGLALAYGADAAMMLGRPVEARELVARGVRLAEHIRTKDIVLALPYAMLGRRGDVLRLDRETVPFLRTEGMVIALALLDEWERVEARLPSLEDRGARGDRYSAALAAALREALAARAGGPRPTHAALHDLGYIGISEVLRFRPTE